jgi:hypothetical protein
MTVVGVEWRFGEVEVAAEVGGAGRGSRQVSRGEFVGGPDGGAVERVEAEKVSASGRELPAGAGTGGQAGTGGRGRERGQEQEESEPSVHTRR